MRAKNKGLGPGIRYEEKGRLQEIRDEDSR
jgi:hypothetical protein